jgi:hypothetical protein
VESECGNDFVVIGERKKRFDLEVEKVEKVKEVRKKERNKR